MRWNVGIKGDMKMKKNKQKTAMTPVELSSFCSQISLMLKAGMPLDAGLELLASNRNEKEAEAFGKMHQSMLETGSLYDAMEKDGRFPEYLVEMTGIGERTGHLEDVMRGMTAYYEREARMKDALRNAVAYPLVLGSMLVVIVLILLWKVLPVFRRVLSSMGVSAAQSGGGLMQVGATIGWIVLAVVGVVLLGVLACLILAKTKVKDKMMRILRKLIPALGDLSMHISGSRVASVLSMMLSSGFLMEDALNTVPRVLDDSEAVEKVKAIGEKINMGETFSDAIAVSGLFDELHTRLLQTGVMTGSEDMVMEKIAATYEEETEVSIARIIAVIEPTVVALLSIVIGAVLLSVMLPMASILTSLL